MKYLYILLVILILTYILYLNNNNTNNNNNNNNNNNLTKYSSKSIKANKDNTLIVRHPERIITSASAFYLEPILKNIYNDKIIEFTDDHYIECDIVIRSFWNKDYYNDEKYIFISPEPDRHSHPEYHSFHRNLNDKCICAFLTSIDMINNYKKHKPNIKYYYLPYFLDVHTNIQLYINIDLNLQNIYMRPKIAAYIASYSPEHRDQMFKALKKLDTNNLIDSLGKSNKTVTYELYSSHWKDTIDIYKNYKFVLAMENINEEGYITEKIMNVFFSGAIPIYWGTDYIKRIFNPESFIYVPDFASYNDCAKYVFELSSNPTKLLKMQQAEKFNKNLSANDIDYSKYYNEISPQWVLDISEYIKNNL